MPRKAGISGAKEEQAYWSSFKKEAAADHLPKLEFGAEAEGHQTSVKIGGDQLYKREGAVAGAKDGKGEGPDQAFVKSGRSNDEAQAAAKPATGSGEATANGLTPTESTTRGLSGGTPESGNFGLDGTKTQYQGEGKTWTDKQGRLNSTTVDSDGNLSKYTIWDNKTQRTTEYTFNKDGSAHFTVTDYTHPNAPRIRADDNVPPDAAQNLVADIKASQTGADAAHNRADDPATSLPQAYKRVKDLMKLAPDGVDSQYLAKELPEYMNFKGKSAAEKLKMLNHVIDLLKNPEWALSKTKWGIAGAWMAREIHPDSNTIRGND